MTIYNLKSLDLPKLTGRALKTFTAALENPVGRSLLLNSLMENGGVPVLRELTLEEPPTLQPLYAPDQNDDAPVPFQSDGAAAPVPYRTIRDYATAYRRGDLVPEQAAEAVLAAIDTDQENTCPLRAFVAVSHDDVLAQARASAERIQAGKPLSRLDGVPVAVKDEIDLLPYTTRVGTRFLGVEPPEADSTVAARLRAAGALLIGKTAMHEIGIAPNGFNAHTGTVHNPYDEGRDPGGSSCGSAAAVSAGLVPVAIGADGGGSIRIPAALCGVVGLKPTFGRVSEAGAAPLCWSVGHLGPLTTCVEDAALVYSVIAGPDPRDLNSLVQPPVTLADWNRPDLQGVTVGVDPNWFNHSAEDVANCCWDLVEALQAAGAEVDEIVVPELDEMRVAHAVTILSEMAAAMLPYRALRNEMAPAVRLSLVLGEAFSAMDYLQAQRMRTRAAGIFQELFTKVDVILTPATALPAQPFPADAFSAGWSDLSLDTEMMRYVFPGNLVGLPAISFPAGYDAAGLPIGMQAMGRHWEENLLLRVAYNAERRVERHLPGRYYRVF
jgi:Asp-tRNA(Asn)/Glu-tRNA(Gln) amidotransferase A subunit family amidase